MQVNKFIKNCILTSSIVLSALSISAQDYTLSYSSDDTSTRKWGTGKEEYYDVAIYVPAVYAGKTITGIKMPFATTSTDITDVKLWLSKELLLEKNEAGKKVAAPDIVSVNANINSDGYAEVIFNEPYTVTDKGVYAGCTFNIAGISDQECRTPIYISEEGETGSLWLHSSKTYMKWDDKSQSLGASNMQVILNGVTENAVYPRQTRDTYSAFDKNFDVRLQLINVGSTEVSDIDVSYKIGNVSGSQHVVLPTAIENRLNASIITNITIEAVGERGTNDLTLNIDKVNGQSNTQLGASVTIPVTSISFIPEHRVACEEYTGFWCGWCPRGFVGLERMNELYPDQFIGIVYHNRDELEVFKPNQFPIIVTGYPDCYLERTNRVDPYTGYYSFTEDCRFGINEAWLRQSEEVVFVAVDASAELSNDGEIIDGTIRLTSAVDVKDHDYHLELVLTADDLSNENWEQQSNFNESHSDGKEDWLPFISESSVKGLHFNDIIVASSRVTETDVIVEDQLIDNTPVEYSYQFDLSTICTSKGLEIIQDKSKLNFIAMLIDADGKIINSAKAKILNSSGIQLPVIEDSSSEIVDYYDLTGRKVNNPEQGIYIVRSANGQTHKVLLK